MADEIDKLDWLQRGISENKETALEDSRIHFESEIELINLLASVVGSLAIYTVDPHRKKNKLLSDTYPATDWAFHAHITDIVNSLLAIKELSINGFDNQARSIVRVLDERIFQNLILFSRPDDYEKWSNSQDSKNTHYELFSKRKSIYKKIQKLEKKYLQPENSEELLSFRKEMEEYYSDNIHGSSTSVYLGSMSCPFGDLDEGAFTSVIFGRASSGSYQTLHHTIRQMAYFLIMTKSILDDCHNLKEITNDDLISVFNDNIGFILEKQRALISSRTLIANPP